MKLVVLKQTDIGIVGELGTGIWKLKTLVFFGD
jgi:hypothetical protein